MSGILWSWAVSAAVLLLLALAQTTAEYATPRGLRLGDDNPRGS